MPNASWCLQNLWSVCVMKSVTFSVGLSLRFSVRKTSQEGIRYCTLYLLAAPRCQDVTQGQFHGKSPSACTRTSSKDSSDPTTIGCAGIGITTPLFSVMKEALPRAAVRLDRVRLNNIFQLHSARRKRHSWVLFYTKAETQLRHKSVHCWQSWHDHWSWKGPAIWVWLSQEMACKF